MSLRQENDALCSFCRSLNLTVDCFLGSAGTESNSQAARFHKVTLPSSNIIQGNTRCLFCRLLISAIVESNAENADIQTLLTAGVRLGLEWIKDGRMLESQAVKTQSTRCLRLFSIDKTISESYLVLLASEQYNQDFLGRQVVSGSIDLQRVRGWLKDCETKHGTVCTQLRSSATKDLYKHPSFRLIDVESGCIAAGVREPYLALSYCWGTERFDRLVDRNLVALSQPGSLSGSRFHLSRTIHNAIELTKLLGYRYLWVDALCIIQDNPNDWARITQEMYVIYAGASLTICAASGDAHSGIPGVLDFDRKFSQTVGSYGDTVKLMVFQPAEVYIKRSSWDTRAWTFQERLCSNRCLILVEGRTYFQCQTTMMCEDIHMEHLSALDGAQGWSLMLKELPGRIFADNPLRQYTKFIELYTIRELSYQKDKLPAFMAIEKLLVESLNSDFCFGLPTSYFDFALLWTPTKPPIRIPGNPSWSWCGWQNAIEYRYETLEGILSNLGEWLESHTWIQWDFVNARGNREPVWTGGKSGLKGRWKGYDKKARVDDEDKKQETSKDTQELEHGPQTRKVVPKKRIFDDDDDDNAHLRFHTHSAFFKLETLDTPPPSSASASSSLHWHSLSDSSSDWCGTVLLSAPHSQQLTSSPCEFIAISEARDFSTKEHDSWTFYVPKDRVDSQWDLYYVLAVMTDERGYKERVGLGKVFKDAFRKSWAPGYGWREILLK